MDIQDQVMSSSCHGKNHLCVISAQDLRTIYINNVQSHQLLTGL